MCVVSNIGDQWRQTAPQRFPWIQPYIVPNQFPPALGPTREEFEALKREIEALKRLLTAAKEYDQKTGQPDCEHDAKVVLIKKLAELVGVDMSDIFPASAKGQS